MLNQTSHGVAGEALLEVHMLEDSEEVLGVGHVEAGPVVADVEGTRAVGVQRADLHAGGVVLGRELPRVV